MQTIINILLTTPSWIYLSVGIIGAITWTVIELKHAPFMDENGNIIDE